MLDQVEIDRLRGEKIAPQKLFIDGGWVSGEGDELEVLSPIDGSVLTTLTRGSSRDMARAIASARTAFDDGRWSRMPPAGRKKVLHRLACFGTSNLVLLVMWIQFIRILL